MVWNYLSFTGGVCVPASGLDSEGEEFEISAEGDELRRQKRKTPDSKKLTKEQISEIQKTIEDDRRQLKEQKDMEVHERDKIKVSWSPFVFANSFN